MCDICDSQIAKIWNSLLRGQSFRTPDAQNGVDFFLDYIDREKLKITPQNIRISKAAFAATLHYLKANGHDEYNQCKIRSSNNPASAGPLCIEARHTNNDTRCINYILPILAQHSIVAINPRRPNTTWLIKMKNI